MRFTLTEDQRLLVQAVADVLAGECTPAHVRTAWETGGFDPGRWKALADLGVVGLTVAPEHGGMGLGELDLVPVLVEAGRCALPEPVLEVVGVAAPLLADLGGEIAATWLPRLAAGEAVVVPVLDGYPAHVTSADLLLVAQGDGVHAVAPSAATVTAQPGVDGARPTATVTIPDQPPTWSGPQADVAVARARARAATGAAALQVGVGLAVIDQAVAYAKQREQFGKPIGTFQAVKHHLASALVDVQFARPLVERAAHAISTGDPAAATHAAMAKAFADDAAAAAIRHSLQVHGAIGYTWECDLHLWMKRSWSLAASFGDTEAQWQAVEAALLP